MSRNLRYTSAHRRLKVSSNAGNCNRCTWQLEYASQDNEFLNKVLGVEDL
jgi:hypothetical protein